MLVDFHTHSTASDGVLTPSALVEAAAAAGIGALALTDHDSIDGLDEAAQAAKKAGISFIRGVELEIDWPETGAMGKRDFHLLGIGLGEISPKLDRILTRLKRKREKRNFQIIKAMRKMNIDVTIDDIRAVSGGYYIGRPHFAKYLVREKIVKNDDEAFKKYLCAGKPFFVSKDGVRLKTAIAAVKESGGVSVLAHPASLYIAWGRFPDVFECLKKSGLDGVEAYHPNATIRGCERFLELAKSTGLFVSAGSDFHGGSRRDRKLGHGPGGIRLTSALIDFPQRMMSSWGIEKS